MVKKTKTQQTATNMVIDEQELVTIPEEDKTFTNLSKKLTEIRKDKDVTGYIIRNTTSATVDLKDPEKLVEYAIFSSQVLDSSQEILDLFEIGDVRSIFVEGKENNVICMDIDGNKIAIFMEKDADYANIFNKVSP